MIDAAKKNLREKALAERQLIYDPQGRSLLAAANLSQWLQKTHPEASLGIYWPVRHEADPRPLAGLHQAVFALPVVVQRGQPLEFRQWLPGDELIKGDFNIPRPCDSSPIIQPDILIVPLAAFDAQGRRLGYGGGFYDRTLAAFRALKPVVSIGFAFAAQEVPEVPTGPYDQLLDAIVTEKSLRLPVGNRDVR